MKKMLCIVLTLLLALLCGCGGNPGNRPYEPDTPAPAAHDGLFTSEHGSLRFHGDGKTVELELDAVLAGLTGLPEGTGKGSYVFLSGELPPNGSVPVRYDAAHELRLTVGEQSVVLRLGILNADGKAEVGVNTVTPERIPLLFPADSGYTTVIFTKEAPAR